MAFQRLETNGDGKLSADEVATIPSLARLLGVADTDRDGGLSRDEIRAVSQRFPALAQLLGEKPPGRKGPAAPKSGAKGRRSRIPLNNAPIDPKWGPDVEPRETTLKFTFVPDFLPGTKDANGEVLGGTELMRLAAHDGKLFAGVGYFGQAPAERPSPSAQVLRKDSAKSGGALDAHFGLGNAASADVTVRLLDGRKKAFNAVEVDKSHVIEINKPRTQE